MEFPINAAVIGMESWSIACWRCANYIFILDLVPGFGGLSKDNCKTRRETFKFWDLVHMILESRPVIIPIITRNSQICDIFTEIRAA